MRRDDKFVPDSETGEAAFAMRAGEMDPFAPFGAQFTLAPSRVIVVDLNETSETNPQAEISQM